MPGYRIRRNVVTAVGVLAGLLAGLFCAILSTRHLTLEEDPVGLISTWICFLTVCPLLGGAFGEMVGQSLGGRSGVRAAGSPGGDHADGTGSTRRVGSAPPR